MLRFSCQSKNGLDENYKFCADVEIVCIVYVYIVKKFHVFVFTCKIY